MALQRPLGGERLNFHPEWMLRATRPLGMAIKPLQTLGAPCLRARATEVPPEMFGSNELRALVEDMVDTMRHANGAGIAAPQIGEPWRIFVAHGTGDNPRHPYKPKIPLTVFVNPVIEVIDETPMHMVEGCLSIPGFRGRVDRACKVRCRAQRPEDGSWFTITAEGHAAGTLQHELDHLDCTLFTDLAGAENIMTAESFEQHAKSDFFAYAAEINARYPTPLVWEEGDPPAEPTAATPSLSGDEQGAQSVAYVPELTWTGAGFERGVRVTVCGDSGRVTAVERIGEAAADGGEQQQERTTIALPGRALLPGFVNAHSHAFQVRALARPCVMTGHVSGPVNLPSARGSCPLTVACCNCVLPIGSVGCVGAVRPTHARGRQGPRRKRPRSGAGARRCTDSSMSWIPRRLSSSRRCSAFARWPPLGLRRWESSITSTTPLTGTVTEAVALVVKFSILRWTAS
eukprot:SAG11_NODE_2696_length_3080_cov_2.220731_3_plen_459_part_00